MSRSEAPPSRLQIYGSRKGDEAVGHNDAQFPDLSAFLSQEELDKSVNLACQAIGHGPHEERVDVKVSVTTMPTSNISSAPVSLSTLPSISSSNHSPAPFANPVVPFIQSAPEVKELPAAHTAVTLDRKVHKPSTHQDKVMRNSRNSTEGFDNHSSPAKSAPYGVETQSKKEFLNKAADFIEELSSLFKANSSKRVRPRACKTHRSRLQNKNDQMEFPGSADNRERAVLPLEAEKEIPNLDFSQLPVVQQDPGCEQVEFQDNRTCEEEQFDSVSQDIRDQAGSFPSTETSHQAESACEPPHFIQKLKSREVPEGTKVQLDCIVRGHPLPEVRWFCEGKELENSPDIQIITSGELNSLIIAEAFEEDTGRYSCFASNVYGTDSTSAEIYVEGATSSDSEEDQQLEHVAQLQRNQLKSHLPRSSNRTQPAGKEDLESSQAVTASREPAEELSSPNLIQIFSEAPVVVQTSSVPEHLNASELNPSLADTTELPVQVLSDSLNTAEPIEASAAVTSAPQLEQTVSTTVTSQQLNSPAPPDPLTPAQTHTLQSQTSNHNFSHGVSEQLAVTAPAFTKNLQDITASEGQLVVLECRVKGVPSPWVDWYREGNLIEDSPDFRILQKKPRSPAESEEICSLVIAEVFSVDSGRFTCTASNKYGTVSSTATLKVKGNSCTTQVRHVSGSVEEPDQTQELFPLPPAANSQPEVPVTSSIKPHSSTIHLEPLVCSTSRPNPLSTCTLRLDPNGSSMFRPDALRTSLSGPDPSSLTSCSGRNYFSASTPKLDPPSVYLDPQGSSGSQTEPRGSKETLLNQKPFTCSPADEQEVSRPSVTLPDSSSSLKGNGSPCVVPLPDPPPNSCLKSGTLTNYKDSRSGSRVGLRVHFKLPEDEQEDGSSHSDEDIGLASGSKEPPPVLAKPKLDPAQLQLLHSQVLMEQQQQETEPQTQTHSQPKSKPPFQVEDPSEVHSSQERFPWSPRFPREPQEPSPQSHLNTTVAPQLTPTLTTSFPVPSSSALSSTNTSSAPPFSVPPSIQQIKTAMTSPPLAPLLNTTPVFSVPPISQINTIHASHLNLFPAALARTSSKPPFFTSPAPTTPTVPADPPLTLQDITSPTPQLKSTHASLLNLSLISSTFNYARPKEFITAQTFSPVRSPSPTESPVPLLQELAAELNSSETSSPIPPPFSPPPRISPTRVLKSPTSPPSLVSSPTPGSVPYLNSMLALRAQSPPQAASPTSSSSTPSPIQNPVAFLSSVLPSLTPSQPTNSMGLPKGAPVGVLKKTPKKHFLSAENITESKEFLILDIQKKLRLKDDTPQFSYQQKLSNKGKTANILRGPNQATVINYDEEYKISNFEHRLMSEIEFRLERTPVEESDDEVQHDDIPTGKCIAPIFEKKLKNFKAIEGVPVTFTCKVMGIPPPKVYWFKDGKQILRKNLHYRKIREGDGTCALHMESTTSDDDGNYTVMAANPQGRMSCSGHLIVQSAPPRNQLTPIQSQRVRTRVQEVEGEQTQERFFRPHFLQAPGDMMANEGKLCRLDCKVSGLPNPELMWLVNGKPVYPDLCHKMLVRENGIHSLVIDPLTQNDEGTYTCIASNKAGQSSFSLELKVVEKEMKQPPRFVEKLQNVGIPEGTPVRLECRVTGMPHPVIFWKKDNETISKTKDRISMTQDTAGYVCLLIQPTTKDDAGWYTVSAKNDAGIVSCTCRLDIYAQWHQSIPAPMRKAQRTSSRYAVLTGQGLDIKSAFPTSDTSPILFASSPPEATLEGEEL
ncbi:myopalladin isoform X2 [Nothobranchius furzeri]|uniref:Myopalladin n=1 Tax=Nothobranchius furzeri TaxID=105023 RepID=A0A8C6Q752_NOTFU|nr:myopalladin isoform X2 [Nothobranchius furzeri]